jgi:hypothetical protein
VSGNWQPFVGYRGQAEGALKNGSTIEKVGSLDGDTHLDGALGTVIGSMGPLSDSAPDRFVYCVEFMDAPHVPVWIVGHRIREVVAS